MTRSGRHIAVVVKDLDKAVEFYSKVFEFKKIGREDLDIGSAIYMSDGVINMALLNFAGKGGEKASDIKEGTVFVGAHHFGIQVLAAAQAGGAVAQLPAGLARRHERSVARRRAGGDP